MQPHCMPPPEAMTLSDNYVSSLAVDNDNRLYIGTGFGVTVFEPERNRAARYLSSTDVGLPDPHMVRALTVDNSGRLLIGTLHQGLHVLDLDKRHYHPFPVRPEYEDLVQKGMISSVLHDAENRIWLTSMTKPLMRIDADGDVVTFTIDAERAGSIRSTTNWGIYEDATGRIWVATDDSGFEVFNEQSQGFEALVHSPYQATSISSDQVRSFYQDELGDIWIGTFTSQINYHNSGAAAFEHFYHSPGTNSLSNNGVMSFAQTDRESIWIGTENGLNRFNPLTRRFTHYTSENTNGALVSDAILSIVPDARGLLWLGTTMGGLHSFDPKTERFRHFGLHGAQPTAGQDNFIWDVLIDEHNIWTGTLFGGLSKYDLAGEKVGNFRTE